MFHSSGILCKRDRTGAISRDVTLSNLAAAISEGVGGLLCDRVHFEKRNLLQKGLEGDKEAIRRELQSIDAGPGGEASPETFPWYSWTALWHGNK